MGKLPHAKVGGPFRRIATVGIGERHTCFLEVVWRDLPLEHGLRAELLHEAGDASLLALRDDRARPIQGEYSHPVPALPPDDHPTDPVAAHSAPAAAMSLWANIHWP